MGPSPKTWLMKTEPNEYSYQDLERDGQTKWDGVHNYQARNNMKLMAVGDWVLIYHSVGPKEVVGLAQVSKAAYPDPNDDTGKWVLVDVKPVCPIKKPVHLDVIKQHPVVQDIPLVKQSRLSVMPLSWDAFTCLLELGNTPLPQALKR